ncbi:MAG: energy transducer TonB [Rhodocyclales bacterium RIFCSPLOWO2_02_FULL_63_24]|nr:MAG: energy transducer TonB [Rhodocyclales bacterium GWA2_65_19]OHC68141.1 MAG: energy transducer TonB [Rhodocyclales bacterium RIFCSPLOWO2_02_FULL_63_24]
MDAPRRNLTLALGASLLIHAVVLAIRFTPPDFIDKARERALDVILVNSKSKSRPNKAQAKAQTSLDGGGNTEEDRRARTPLPPSPNTREGRELLEAQRRVAELEAQQQEMLTRLASEKAIAANKNQNKPTPTPEPSRSGVDLANSALAIARIEGQISRQLDEYNQRPRKKFIGARVEEYRFAQYVEDWRQKIERIGNLNYPDAVRGRLYGSLVLTVIIKANGDLERVEVSRSSGKSLLDDAARRIVQMAAPYAAFPDAIRRDTDVLEITRTWTFTNADRLRSD